MKGVIFNLFESFVVDSFGQDVYEDILDEAQLRTEGGIFVGPESYPDEDLLELVSVAVKKLNVKTEDAVRSFGKYMFPKLVELNPKFADDYDNPKDFLKSINDVVHVEVGKLFKNAITPIFKYLNEDEKKISIQYESPRKLCHLMEGLIEGTAEHYKTTIKYTQTKCMHKNDDYCLFELTFS